MEDQFDSRRPTATRTFKLDPAAFRLNLPWQPVARFLWGLLLLFLGASSILRVSLGMQPGIAALISLAATIVGTAGFWIWLRTVGRRALDNFEVTLSGDRIFVRRFRAPAVEVPRRSSSRSFPRPESSTKPGERSAAPLSSTIKLHPLLPRQSRPAPR